MDSDDDDFVTYGTALEPIDEENVPRKKAFTVEDQYATDEHGRRRFHGAFTGGFSAGFCNSVGSLEGWQPSTFKSSRSTRTEIKSQSVFDYMDDEDKGDHGICPMSIQVKSSFDDKSSDRSTKKRQRDEVASKGLLTNAPVLQKLFTPTRDTIGVKLLMKMGWKLGQGVGPRLSKKEKHLTRENNRSKPKVYGCVLPEEFRKSDDDSDESDIDINLDEITFAPDDYKPFIVQPKQNSFGLGYTGMDKKNILSSNKPELSKLTVNGKTIRGHAFGVSVFEDEDADIYSTDDMSNYDFSLGPANEPKRSKSRFDRNDDCIDGFHIARKPNKQREKFPLPDVPNDFVPLKSHKIRWDSTVKTEPKKKITAVQDRMMIIDDEERKIVPEVSSKPCTSQKEIPTIVDQTSSSTFKPFASDSDKQSRYEKFLMFKKLGLIDRLNTIYPTPMTEWEREREKYEFEKASNLYKPLSDDMASRFTVGTAEDVHDILKPVERSIDLGQQVLKEAVAKRKYGPLTRKKFPWVPDRLLCKRFNIPDPVVANSLSKEAANTNAQSHKSSIFEFLKSDKPFEVVPVKLEEISAETIHENAITSISVEDIPEPPPREEPLVTENDEQEIDEEIKGITEKVDLYRAIFLSSSDEESDAEESSENVTQEKIDANDNNDKIPNTKPLPSAPSIVYSPPRGIFKNLDLDALRCQPREDMKSTKITSNVKEESKSEALAEIPQPISVSTLPSHAYGPALPINIQQQNAVRPSHTFKSKIKKEDEIWVEKHHKHKKHHKKHKKHKKHK